MGHSRVLDPKLRPPDKAFEMARQLTVKAATRLRRYKLYARKLSLQVRSVDGARWANDLSFAPTQDNFALIKSLEKMWQTMLWDMGAPHLKKVSVSIHDLHKSEDVTLDLFETSEEQKRPSIKLSNSMDEINRRYGANTVSVGSCPKTSAGYVGTKIAFTRVPEKAEFGE